MGQAVSARPRRGSRLQPHRRALPTSSGTRDADTQSRHVERAGSRRRHRGRDHRSDRAVRGGRGGQLRRRDAWVPRRVARPPTSRSSARSARRSPLSAMCTSSSSARPPSTARTAPAKPSLKPHQRGRSATTASPSSKQPGNCSRRAALGGSPPRCCECSTRSVEDRRRARSQDAPRESSTAAIRRGDDSITLGSLDSWRDYIDARDVGGAVAAAMHTVPDGATVLNVGRGEAVHTRDLVESLAAIAGFEGRIIESDDGSSRSSPVPWQRADISTTSSWLQWSPRHSIDASLQDLWSGVREGVPA